MYYSQWLPMFATLAKPVHEIYGAYGKNSCALCNDFIDDDGKSVTFEYCGTMNVEHVCIECYLEARYNDIVKIINVNDYKN